MEKLSKKDKKRIIELHYEGKNVEDISRETEFSEYVVRRTIVESWKREKDRIVE